MIYKSLFVYIILVPVLYNILLSTLSLYSSQLPSCLSLFYRSILCFLDECVAQMIIETNFRSVKCFSGHRRGPHGFHLGATGSISRRSDALGWVRLHAACCWHNQSKPKATLNVDSLMPVIQKFSLAQF